MQWIALQWPPEPTRADGRIAAPRPRRSAGGRCSSRRAWPGSTRRCCSRSRPASGCGAGGGADAPDCRIESGAAAPVRQAQGATSLIALARLRMFARGEQAAGRRARRPCRCDTLSAAREHLDLLARMGCRTWGDVAALPRGGLARRFGAALREALDVAWGLRPESHRWLTLPDVFEQKLELPALAERRARTDVVGQPAAGGAADLAAGAPARRAGARTAMDARPASASTASTCRRTSSLVVRTAEPTQDMAHLRRLMAERLALTDAGRAGQLAAPALARHRALGRRQHQLPARRQPQGRQAAPAGRAPERAARARSRCWCRWRRPTTGRSACRLAAGAAACCGRAPGGGERRLGRACARRRATPRREVASRAAGHGIYPAWLLPEPLPLEMRDGHPCYHGRAAPAGRAAAARGRLVGRREQDGGRPGGARLLRRREPARPAWSGSTASGLLRRAVLAGAATRAGSCRASMPELSDKQLHGSAGRRGCMRLPPAPPLAAGASARRAARLRRAALPDQLQLPARRLACPRNWWRGPTSWATRRWPSPTNARWPAWCAPMSACASTCEALDDYEREHPDEPPLPRNPVPAAVRQRVRASSASGWWRSRTTSQGWGNLCEFITAARTTERPRASTA